MPEALAIPVAEAAFGEAAFGALGAEAIGGFGAGEFASAAYGGISDLGVGAFAGSGYGDVALGEAIGGYGPGEFSSAAYQTGAGAGAGYSTGEGGPPQEYDQFGNRITPQGQMDVSDMQNGARGADTALNGMSQGIFSGPAGGFGDAMGKVFGPIGGGTNVGGMNMGISPFDIAKGAYGLYNSNKLKGLAGQLQQQADPNAQYRPGYASQLNNLASDPSAIYKMPGWEAGQEAVQRSMAAQGYQGSGNMAVALQKYGGDFYNQALSQYGNLAGIGFNPAGAAQIGLQANTDAINLAGQSLNSLGYGGAGGARQGGLSSAQIMSLINR